MIIVCYVFNTECGLQIWTKVDTYLLTYYTTVEAIQFGLATLTAKPIHPHIFLWIFRFQLCTYFSGLQNI